MFITNYPTVLQNVHTGSIMPFYDFHTIAKKMQKMWTGL